MEQAEFSLNDEVLKFLEKEFEINDLNLLPEEYGGAKIFDMPLIGVASADDPIFQKYKQTIGPEHLTPLEMWLTNGQDYASVSQLRTMSVIFPFTEDIRRKSIETIKIRRLTLPPEVYTVARNYGNIFKLDIIEKLINFFKERGFEASSGMLSKAYSIILKGKFYTTWSERYIAFAAGLGSLGLHEGLITEAGCNVRLGSIITNAPLQIPPRKSDEPYANCLYYAKGLCKECADRCPVNAITEDGYNKIKCNKYRMKIARKTIPRLKSILKSEARRVNWKMDEETYIVGCEICQFGVKCTNKNPTASQYMDFFSS